MGNVNLMDRKTKFTKGEWYANISDNEFWVESVDDGCTVAELNFPSMTIEERQANTLLMSKAKDMYKMLIKASKDIYMLIDEVNDRRCESAAEGDAVELVSLEMVNDIEKLTTEARGEDY